MGRSRRGRGEAGAVLVEAAFVFPVLVVFLFGIIEYGFVFKDSLTVTSATRSGARASASQSRYSTFFDAGQSAVQVAVNALPNDGPQELWIYKAGPNGRPVLSGGGEAADFSSPCQVCARYAWSSSTRAWTLTSSTWPVASQNACASTSTDPDSFGVYLKAKHDYFTQLFGSSRSLSDRTVMRLEPRPSDSCAPSP
jgi:hypothetical protein